MPPTISVAAFVFGVVFVLAALIGKEIEVVAIKIPALNRGSRITLGIAGVLLIYIGLTDPFSNRDTATATTTALANVTPTNVTLTETPVMPTNTPLPLTNTPVPLTDTPVPESTNTPMPPTHTPVPPTDTPISPTNTPVPEPPNTLSPTNTPQIYGFFALDRYGNVSNTFEERTREIYMQWSYENFPIGAHYVRTWTMNGEKWVRYDCIWSDLETGRQEITLREPHGLRSGTWELSIYVNNQLLLREQIFVEGNWDYWDPVEDDINSCETR